MHRRGLPYASLITRVRATVAGNLGFAVAVLLYLASRAPLLSLGLGSDHDAWSLAANAPALVFQGEYRISRAPGHPVHEVLQSLFIALGGPVVANVFTFAVATALLIVVARIGRELQVTRVKTAVAALAVHPLLWITSAESTDFALASLFAYSSLLAGIRDRPGMAGVLLGLAGGTRVETLAFILPLIVLMKRAPWRRAIVAMTVTLAICYLPVAAYLASSPWAPGDLVTSVLSPTTRVLVFSMTAWAACGLVPLLAASALLMASNDRLRRLMRERDDLLMATGWIVAAYLVVTFLHPGKATYYVPLVPLVVLALAKVASGPWPAVLVAAFLSYSLVYPDVFDRVDDAVKLGFRWNNGLVVKDWVARWNATRASDLIDRNRPRGPVVIVLAYWLPLWRYAHPSAGTVDHLAPGVPVHAGTNLAYAQDDGAILVHKLDRASAETLHRNSIPLAYGEGVETFLQQTYGYDIRTLSATEIAVRDLGPQVAESFSLPRLVSCALSDAVDWHACLSPRPGVSAASATAR